MKSMKLLVYAFFAVLIIGIQSCTKDDIDNSGPSPSERLQNYLSSAQQTLINSNNGWILEMYPGNKLEYGGTVYTCKFDADMVEVLSEKSVGETAKSYYKMTTDYGPVITFDTYNKFIHEYSTPSSSAYQGKNGDFEFVIDSIGEDRIKVHAKRTGNSMVLKKLTVDAATYISNVANVANTFAFPKAEGLFGADSVKLLFNIENNQLTYISSDSTIITTVPYCYSDKGINLYTPLSIGNETISTLSVDFNTNIITGMGSNGSLLSVTGELPAGYQKFDDIQEGIYNFTYWNGYSGSVTLTADKVNNRFLLKDDSTSYSIALTYNKVRGRLEWKGQTIGTTKAGYTAMLLPWALGSSTTGTFYNNSSYGLYLRWNPATSTYTFRSISRRIAITSFIIWTYDSSGTSMGRLDENTDPELLFRHERYIPYITNGGSMIKQ